MSDPPDRPHLAIRASVEIVIGDYEGVCYGLLCRCRGGWPSRRHTRLYDAGDTIRALAIGEPPSTVIRRPPDRNSAWVDGPPSRLRATSQPMPPSGTGAASRLAS